MSEEGTVKQNVGFDEILASVAELNKQQMVQVYVPTLGEEISFKPLSVKQQKTILSSGVDSEVENLSFSNTANQLILDNCLSNKDKITTIDRPSILYQLRANSLGNVYKMVSGNETIEIDINEHIEKIKTIEVPEDLSFKTSVDTLEITGRVPTLKTDTSFNVEFTRIAKNIRNSKRGLTMVDIIGDIYIYEMAKFLTSIQLNDNRIDLLKIRPDQAVSVFENLPMTASIKVSEKIKKLREIESQSTTYGDGVQLPFDASLFTND